MRLSRLPTRLTYYSLSCTVLIPSNESGNKSPQVITSWYLVQFIDRLGSSVSMNVPERCIVQSYVCCIEYSYAEH